MTRGEWTGILLGIVAIAVAVLATIDSRRSANRIAALAEGIEFGLRVEKRMRVADAAHRVLEHVWRRQDAIERGSTRVAHEKVERVMTQFGDALAVAAPVELPASWQLNAKLVKYTSLSFMGKEIVSPDFLEELRQVAQAAYDEANPASEGDHRQGPPP